MKFQSNINYKYDSDLLFHISMIIVIYAKFLFDEISLLNYSNDSFHIIWNSIKYCLCNRDNFVYAPSQWETTLQCNVVSHWLGAYTKWSLAMDARYNMAIEIHYLHSTSDNVTSLTSISFGKGNAPQSIRWLWGLWPACIIIAFWETGTYLNQCLVLTHTLHKAVSYNSISWKNYIPKKLKSKYEMFPFFQAHVIVDDKWLCLFRTHCVKQLYPRNPGCRVLAI